MNSNILEFVKNALAEDIGRGDLFANCVKPKQATAHIIAKQQGVLAGEKYAYALAEMADIKMDFHFSDGDELDKGDVIAVISGPHTTLLSIERVLLNMLQHASGIATNARRYAKILQGSRISMLDTRKTRPLLRVFEKYAARCGGVVNHRMGLDDSLMLKDTHLKTIEELGSFIAHARREIPFTSKIEVECESPDMAQKALEAGADIIMCDNMSIADIEKVVASRDRISKNVLIEVSGNITEETLQKYKKMGIDAISSGSIVHQATWLDFSMKMQ